MQVILQQMNNKNKGIIIKALSGFYYVEFDNKIYTCKAKGTFRKQNIKPLVGDNVIFDVDDLIIEEIIQRKNSLLRPPVANIDKMFIISSHQTPSPNVLNIDRLIAVAENNGIEPILIFNKSDLGSFTEYENIYKNAGFKCITTSAFSKNAAEQILPHIKDSISVFTGNSGVGKSSLINSIFKDSSLIKTGEVSEKLGRGRHTTRHVELFKIDNAYIADTPGFSAIEIEKMLNCEKEDLHLFFREFKDYTDNCKFTSCSHCSEKGCAVIDAVNNNQITKSRHNSYVTLYNELKQIKHW